MLPPPFENALVLTGPTGSGKTQLGLELARRMNAEIISMDSMALYRRMDIGTAKPTLGSAALHQRLAAIDPISARRLHPNDVRRMIRAIEVYELTGKPMSAWQTQWSGVRSQETGVRGQESLASDPSPLTPDSCLLT